MNRRELIADLVEDIVAAFPDKDADITGEDIDTIETVFEETVKNLEIAVDAEDEVEDEEKA